MLKKILIFYFITFVNCKKNNDYNILFISNDIGLSLKYGFGKSSYSMIDTSYSRNLYNKILDCDINKTYTKTFDYKNNNLEDYDYYEFGYYGNIIIGKGINKSISYNTTNRSIGKPQYLDYILYYNDDNFLDVIFKNKKCIRKSNSISNNDNISNSNNNSKNDTYFFFKSICLFFFVYYLSFRFIFKN